MDAREALKNGTITLTDSTYLRWISNLKQAQAYLSMKDTRGRINAAKAKQADIEANAMQQQASNAQAQAGKERLEELKTMGAIMEKWAEKVLETEKPEVALQTIKQELSLIYGEQQSVGRGNEGNLSQQSAA